MLTKSLAKQDHLLYAYSFVTVYSAIINLNTNEKSFCKVQNIPTVLASQTVGRAAARVSESHANNVRLGGKPHKDICHWCLKAGKTALVIVLWYEAYIIDINSSDEYSPIYYLFLLVVYLKVLPYYIIVKW
jgi:hypothetical protein